MQSSTQTLASLPPRERILEAAHKLFYSEGIRATGVDRIIEQSSVSKVTFYRQYASKDDLIRAYLDYRHENWISWFKSSLKEKSRNGSIAADALVATLRSWFVQPDFRGCAFLNAAAELGSADPEILRVVCRHKQDMSSVLDEFFSGRNLSLGRILSVVIDGAIVHAQMGRPVEEVLEDFKTSVKAIMA
ncbi:TetR/AcrR family transcriptional regulator [Rhodoferax sp. TS-BS-61-7]|uniref:TetR/AcrR family transcriptional regulator n=1 Tax=Rhodoferax sp. TS-BS-61-7 TaxID=2094194 RepID=UPI000CF675EA|nr:TetR/AcrR family transcriptional regulator [Rhodoferax sp. TS-BS-61-7]PQA76576.1 TetR/AcrR family transcriptional regulator [Rhodoferax sp. TS-BS-61-7]